MIVFHQNIKKLLLTILLGVLFNQSFAALNSNDQNKPIGFATVDFIPTGGQGGECVTVTNADDLKKYLDATENYVIYVKGAIEVKSIIKSKATNKTLIGLPGSYLFNKNRETASATGILYLKNGNNFIMRNMTFKSAGAYDIDGNDNFCLDRMVNVWIDHCDFQDGVDGNFDCKNQSNNVSVTWCRFRYLIAPQAGGSGGSNDHRFSNLWGSSDTASDNGLLNTTFQYCWWDEGCKERMPRVRFGKIHLLNCLYSSSVTNYCVGIGVYANVLLDRCAFYNLGANSSITKTPAKYDGAVCQIKDNYYDKSCAKVNIGFNTNSSFNPPYSISGVSGDKVYGIVTANNGAGATLELSACGEDTPVNPDNTPIVNDQIVDGPTTWDLENDDYANISATNPINKLYAVPTDITNNLKIDKIANEGYIKFILKANVSGTLTINAINGSSTVERQVFVSAINNKNEAPKSEISNDLAGILPTTATTDVQQVITRKINASENDQAIYIYNTGGAVKYYNIRFGNETESSYERIDNKKLVFYNHNEKTVIFNGGAKTRIYIYNISGFELKQFEIEENETKTISLPKGVYIINGQKHVVE